MKAKEIRKLIDKQEAIARLRAKTIRVCMAMFRNTPYDAIEHEMQKGDPYINDGSFFSFIETSAAAIVPPTPRMRVTALNDNDDLKIVAAYRAALLNSTFRKRDFRRSLKRAYKLADILGESFFRAYWDMDTELPDVEVLTPQEVWYDPTAKRWDKIKWLIHVEAVEYKEFKEKILTTADVQKYNRWNKSEGAFYDEPDTGSRMYDPESSAKIQPEEYPLWVRDVRTAQSNGIDYRREANDEWVTLYHVYLYTSDEYVVFANDCEEPIYRGPLPYLYVQNQFARLTPTLDPETGRGLSGGQIVRNKLEERSNLLTLALQHVYSTIPQRYFNPEAFVDPEKAAKILSKPNRPGTIRELELHDGIPFDEAVYYSKGPQLNPDVGGIIGIIEKEVKVIQGLPEFAQGVTAKGENSATEMSLINQALQTRQGDKIEEIGDFLETTAEIKLLLWEQFLAEDSAIALRMGPRETAAQANRVMLGLRDPFATLMALEEGRVPPPAAPVEFEIEPYQPATNNKSAQLNRSVVFLSLLKDLGMDHWINEERVVNALRELSELGGVDLINTPEEAAAMLERAINLQAAEAGAQGGGAPVQADGAPVGPTDTVEGGGLPAGVAQQVSSTADGAMAGGEGFRTPAPGPAVQG